MKYLLKNGIIVDGLKNRPFSGDVLIEKDKIVAVGKELSCADAIIVQAANKYIIPGMIDAHTHSELEIMYNRQYPAALYQGVTSIIGGQCGLGFAPVRRGELEESIQFNSGIFGDYSRYLKEWSGFSEFLDLLSGSAVNAGANVGHNAVRQMVLGYSNQPLTGKSMELACEQLDRALAEGAMGFSVGLSYYPGGFGDTEELIQLCRVVKKHDGLFCVHLRINDGQIGMTPEEEIARIIEETGVRTNLLHYRTGSMEQSVESLFDPFKHLEDKGYEIHYEYYPYLVGAGLLMALLPGYAQEGGYEAVLNRLNDMRYHGQLVRDIEARKKYFFAQNQTAVITIASDPYSDDIGKSLVDLEKERGTGFGEMIINLLIKHRLQVGFAGMVYQEKNLQDKLYDDQYKLFMHEKYTVSSDSIPGGVLVHPRSFQSFTKTLSVMLERKVPIELIVNKLSKMPADIYHIKDRGEIVPGRKADIAVLDIEKIKKVSLKESLVRIPPEGAEHVFVNGLPALFNGKITGLLNGEAIKGN